VDAVVRLVSHRDLQTPHWLPSIGSALVAVGLGWAGVIVLKMRDEVWARI